MLEVNTRIYVRDPERADDLVPGVVSELLGQKVVVRFLQPVSFDPGAETAVFYHNESNCFTSVPCQLERMFSNGLYPTGSLMLSGEAEVAEKRAATRFDSHDRGITATINGKDSGEVINISCSGIALMLETEEYSDETWVDVVLQYESGEHAGQMQVRSKFKDKDGRFRYGLMADSEDPKIISQLSRITQELQRLTAKDTSPTGTSNKAAAANPQSNSKGVASQQQVTRDGSVMGAQPKPAPPGGTKRMHQRNPWPGMAKVYIREEGNIRILNAETEDLSRGGISFICPQYVYEGTEVMLEKPIEGGFFRVIVLIRNVRVLEGGVHRIGAQFIGAPIKAGEIPKAFDCSVTAA